MILGWLIIVFVVAGIFWAVTRDKPPDIASDIEPSEFRCVVPNCTALANRGRVRFVRAEGFGDYIRRRAGAAPRWRVKEDRYNIRFCESHFWEAFERCRLKLAGEENGRVRALSEAERRLSAYERHELEKELADGA